MTTTPTLSGRQSEILAYLREYQARNMASPSIEELCAALDLKSTSTVAYHLNALQRKGLIRRTGYRALVITPETPAAPVGDCCPHCGKERTPCP